jgi:hypothetical protein
VNKLLVLTGLLLAAARPAVAEVLLAALHSDTGSGNPADLLNGWSQSPPPDPAAYYRLYLAHSESPGGYGPPGWFASASTVLQGTSAPQDFDFFPATVPNWTAAVALLTNGVGNGLGFGFERATGGPFPAWMYSEEGLGAHQETLSGAEITRIHLRFTRISIVPHGNGANISAYGTWQLWGNPIPGPASVWVLSVLLLCRRARDVSPR